MSPSTPCGCWYPFPDQYGRALKCYLPQVELSSATTILATTSRTALTQTFSNTSAEQIEVQYTFPLHDGVSVVEFECTIGEKTIVGIVTEKQQARAAYQNAVNRGGTAGLLERLAEVSDVLTTKIGNVPAGEKIIVKIVYIGELKHDAETDGSRFTIPTVIAPRYGHLSPYSTQVTSKNDADDRAGIRIMVDVVLEEGSIIRGIQSPSHPIAVTMGRTSKMEENAFENSYASATLTLGSTELDKDFVIVILAKGTETPRALLELHPAIPNQRALMTTLVPKFSLPNHHPEIVFIIDRSGSMEGKMETLISAMKIFLKSLPVGVKFNICSFGSHYSFLFGKSRTYDETSMEEAFAHVSSMSNNYGGTEMLNPVQATVGNRYKDLPLEVMLLTDGQIFNQGALFDFINGAVKQDARFFSLGIGSGASSALVEGIARAGDGFAQFVGENEKMDKRVVRMLKGALTPHIKDYTLEVRYSKENAVTTEEDFEIVESFNDSMKLTDGSAASETSKPGSVLSNTISLFNQSAEEEPISKPDAGRYDSLPTVAVPKVLQTPHKVPSLYPFNRTTVYLLLGPESCRRPPESVILRGSSEYGPLELEIPIQGIGSGRTIHQLAAKNAVQDLEQGRGWITEARDSNSTLLKEEFEGRWDLMVEREAVRLGVEFQVGGKWCSFVAIDRNAEDAEQANGTGESVQEHSASTVSDQKKLESSKLPTSTGFPIPQGLSYTGSDPSRGVALSQTLAPFPSYQSTSSFRAGTRFSASATNTPNRLFTDHSGSSITTSAAEPTWFGGFGSANTSSFGASASSSGTPSTTPTMNAHARGSNVNVRLNQSIQNARTSSGLFSSNSAQPSSNPLTDITPHTGKAASGTQSRYTAMSGMVLHADRRFVAPSDNVTPGPNNMFGTSSRASAGHGAPRRQLASKAARAPASAPPSATSADSDASSSPPKPFTDDERMHQLISLQSFNGSWPASSSPELRQLVDLNDDIDIHQAVGLPIWSEEVPLLTVSTTAVVVAWLQVKMKSDEDVWELVVHKAMFWLKAQAQGAQAFDVEDVLRRARSLFQA